MWRRIWAVIQKEFIQTFRDRRTLAVQISIPIIQLLLFAYAIRMNVEDVPTVVADQSLDTSSQAYVASMETSGYFDVIGYVPGVGEATEAIDAGLAQASIVIPPDFAARQQRDTAEALILVDGTDLFTSQSAYYAASLIAQDHAADVLAKRVVRTGRVPADQALVPLESRVRILYNPNLDDLWFMLPGLLATLIQIQTVTLTAASVVREREAGTIEQLLVTPIRSAELMLGKAIPNMLIALVNLLTIAAIGIYWFGVPFQGDFGLFLWLSLLYVVSGLGLGLLISTVSQNQKQSQQLTGMIAMLGVVLAGFIFPRYTMPAPIRLVGNLLPLTYFIQISRGIMTKGVTIDFLWEQVAALVIYIVVIMIVATRLFKSRLD
ncbi:MAG: ABC transporter permease [Chloroflexota bacterium]|nr:MAG: ABC transporter permease [Chloroflexota bacterium]